MENSREEEKRSFFKDIEPIDSVANEITSIFQDFSKEVKAATSQVKILILGGYDKANILDPIKNNLIKNSCFARLVKDFDTREKGIPDNLSSQLAMKESDIILAIDGKRAGFAAECQHISQDDKLQTKTVLFALKSDLKYKELPELNDYRTHFPHIQICNNIDDLIERATAIGLHLAKRKAFSKVQLTRIGEEKK